MQTHGRYCKVRRNTGRNKVRKHTSSSVEQCLKFPTLKHWEKKNGFQPWALSSNHHVVFWTPHSWCCRALGGRKEAQKKTQIVLLKNNEMGLWSVTQTDGGSTPGTNTTIQAFISVKIKYMRFFFCTTSVSYNTLAERPLLQFQNKNTGAELCTEQRKKKAQILTHN